MTTIRFAPLLTLALLAGCGLFTPRTPEPPVEEGGTYLQPSDPDLVVDNVRAAVAELNPRNYARAFAEDFTFVPADAAGGPDQEPWLNWGMDEEAGYFTQLARAAEGRSSHELRLDEGTLRPSTDGTRYVFDATYVLTVNHGRPGLPTTFQGTLRWELAQGADNLWRIAHWTDRAVADEPSWSGLKAAFAP